MTDHTVPLQTQPAAPHRSGRHPVNVGHLVMGVAFLGLTLVWALIASDTVEGADIRWLLPIPWVAAGVAGVLAGVLPSRDRHTQPAIPTATTPTATPASTTTEEIR
jgi:hypothetical protein